MSERPWTEGPWEVAEGFAMVDTVTGGHPVADCECGIDDFENDANARLIAQAPAMYEMLERLEWRPKWDSPSAKFVVVCLQCLMRQDKGHAPDCEMDARLNAANPSRKGGG